MNEKSKKNKIIIFIGTLILILIIGVVVALLVTSKNPTKDDDSSNRKIVNCVLTKEPGKKGSFARNDLSKLQKMQNFYYMLIPERADAKTSDNLFYENVTDTQSLIIANNLEFTDFIATFSEQFDINKSKVVVLDKEEGYYGDEFVTYYSLQAPYEDDYLYAFVYVVATYIDETQKEVYSTEYITTITTQFDEVDDTYSLLNEMFNTRADITNEDNGENLLINRENKDKSDNSLPEPVLKDNIADTSSYDEHVINANGEDIGLASPKYAVEIDLEKDFPYALRDDENWNCLYARLDGKSDMYVDAIKFENESGDIIITNYDQIWDNEDLSNTRGMVMIDISDIEDKSGKWTLTIYSRTDITNVNLGRMPLSLVDSLLRKGFSVLDGPTQEEIYEDSEYEN